MVISNRHRYLYFVVPKCASATVRQSIAPYTDIGYPVTKYPQHQTIRQFLESPHAGLFQEGFFRFTFVRNPYDRLYSGYVQDRYAATQGLRWQKVKDPIFRVIGDDFNRYVREYVRPADRLNAWDWICWCPMHAFAYLDNECVMDFVGRSESVEQSLAELSTRLGLPIRKAADVNVNVSPAGESLKYLERYDRDTLELVNDLYHQDFENFGYTMVDPRDVPVRADLR